MNIDLDNFQKVYNEKLKPLEYKFNIEKKIVHICMVILAIISIAIEIYIYKLALLSPTDNYIFLGFVPIISVTIYMLIREKITNKIKNTIFPKLFESIDSNFIYEVTKETSKDKFIDSKLFTSFRTSYCSQDRITTKIDNKNVELCELEVYVDNGGKRKTMIFSGLFFNMSLDKTLENDIRIVNNKAKDFGILKTLFADDDKVNLENIDFENKYDVYCENQIYARRIITLTFMEKLLNVTNKLDTKVQISFIKDSIYIAISGYTLINDDALYEKKIDMLSIAKELDNNLEILDTIKYLNLDDKIECV